MADLDALGRHEFASVLIEPLPRFIIADADGARDPTGSTPSCRTASTPPTWRRDPISPAPRAPRRPRGSARRSCRAPAAPTPPGVKLTLPGFEVPATYLPSARALISIFAPPMTMTSNTANLRNPLALRLRGCAAPRRHLALRALRDLGRAQHILPAPVYRPYWRAAWLPAFRPLPIAGCCASPK